MDESDVLINLAEDIKKSDRWEQHNERIKLLFGKITDQNEAWYISIFSELTYRVFFEYNKLIKSYENKDLAEIAWRSRNLLELKVWSIFCTKTTENAWLFFGDAGRDANDLLNKLMAWEKQSSEKLNWTDKIEQSKELLNKFSEEKSLGSIEDRFTNVKDAAIEIGIKNEYLTANKILSKLAHPTAFTIIGYLGEDKIEEFQKAIYSMGCSNFADTFHYLENHLEDMI